MLGLTFSPNYETQLRMKCFISHQKKKRHNFGVPRDRFMESLSTLQLAMFILKKQTDIRSDLPADTPAWWKRSWRPWTRIRVLHRIYTPKARKKGAALRATAVLGRDTVDTLIRLYRRSTIYLIMYLYLQLDVSGY